jgi:glycosyltransferase involved in cell wall biosynthesis
MNSFGVIIPTFINSSEDLNRLDSVLHSINFQTQPPNQVVVSDDSTEEFYSLIEILLRKYPELNARLISNPGPKGVSENSNNGLRNINTDFVHILHQDDCLINNDCYARISQYLAGVRGGTWIILSGKTDESEIRPIIRKGKLPKELVLGVNSLGGPSSMIFSRIPSTTFDTRFDMLCDVKMFLDLEKAFGSPHIFTKPEIHYNMGPWQLQKRISEENLISELLLLNSEIRSNYLPLIYRIFRMKKGRDIKLRSIYIASEISSGWYWKLSLFFYKIYVVSGGYFKEKMD